MEVFYVQKGVFSAIKFETDYCFDQNSLRNKLRLRSSLNPSLVINLMQRRNPLMYQQVPLVPFTGREGLSCKFTLCNRTFES